MQPVSPKRAQRAKGAYSAVRRDSTLRPTPRAQAAQARGRHRRERRQNRLRRPSPGAPCSISHGWATVCGGTCTQALLVEAARAVGIDAGGIPVGRLSHRLEHYRLGVAGGPAPGLHGLSGLSEQGQTLAGLADVYESLLVQRRLVDYAA